jgi:hypothetical protein
MTDAVSLTGTIGTWIAVVFAILALVGVVIPLLIYQIPSTLMGEDMSSNFSDTCYGSQFRIL